MVESPRPESTGEMLFISGLEPEEGPTSAEVGQRAVLRKRFWETRDKKASAVFTFTALMQKLWKRLVWPLPKDNMQISDLPYSNQKLKTSGI